MKKLLTILLSLSVLTLSAQQDPKAKEVLDKVSAKTKAYTSMQVEYLFTHENIQDKTKETSQGKLSLKGNKYVLDFMGNTVYCDGTTVYSYIKASNEVNVSSIEGDSESLFNPAKMFTAYQKGFKYKFEGERFEKGRALVIVDLFPEKINESEYSKVRLSIDKDKSQIVTINYFGKDANRFEINVTKLVPNTPLDDNLFVFKKDKFPGVEVVDMR